MPHHRAAHRVVVLAVGLAALAAAPAAAEAPCDVVPPLTDISGDYELSIGRALLFADNRVVPLEAQNTITVAMEAQGDLLMMEADNVVVVLEYADADDGALDYKELEGVLEVEPGDIPALLGCGLEQLPILVGGGVTDTPEGDQIEFEYELMIWNYRTGERPELMGTLSWTGGGMMSLRSVTASPAP